MKLPFAFKHRTRLAGWAMEQIRAFVALIAPWLASPGDRPMSRATLLAVIFVLAAGVASIGYGGALAIRELLPTPRHEVQP
ncbi:hypothetical protein [Lichenifustis flavocetrariae]|uniref:Uncharacterized protein n=1 Tax=Lichenifustis flavocetrariae TaxID=2949735 RepID=A0AA41Z3Y0_9HYPH|nr:hypothetical protein [Lichenifustis flavocetrariae]MCW6512622.1 hypothetical protein [Lichenifustis flavocetrariae]